MQAQQLLQQIKSLVGELDEIKDRKLQYAMVDLTEWLDNKLPQLTDTIGDMEYVLNTEYPDQQLILNAEFDKAAEELSA
ncbi:hypothetical protein [Paenibacillus senegalensis]|uniref:hypothetical protein n=1 Tax=Paenibacillus senegalensis TaxID=1465766 RepID=UPI0002893AC6|nr:hypothetical protein [Paenibacillus senegalensis]